jgi:hypothetical protein
LKTGKYCDCSLPIIQSGDPVISTGVLTSKPDPVMFKTCDPLMYAEICAQYEGDMTKSKKPKKAKWRDAEADPPGEGVDVLLFSGGYYVVVFVRGGIWHRAGWHHNPITLSEGAKWRKLPKRP